MSTGALGEPAHGNDQRLCLVVALLVVALPFAAAEFIPATDLPQHLAQIRLLEELWGLRPPTIGLANLEAHPFGPHTLVYWLIFALTRVAPPIVAGKLVVALLLAGSVVAMYQLARTTGRDPLHVVWGALMLFSVSLNWGFLNFLCGVPLLFSYLTLLSRGQNGASWRAVVVGALLLCVLFWAHAFWVPTAALAALLFAASRRELRWLGWRALSFLPVAVLVALWLPGLVAARERAGFDIGTHYLVPLPERVSWHWFVETLLGSIRGYAETLITAALLGYIAWVCVASRRIPASRTEPGMFALSAAVLAFALVAPDQHLNTILVNRRFLSVGMTLLVLSLPAVRSRALRTLTMLSVTLFSVFTAFAWALYDQDDLTGLRESLAALPEGASVLGLNYRQGSAYIRGNPFIQTFAYAQALKGGELSFSFAEHASSIVTYREPRRIGWTPGLEWLPERATTRDIAAFDCAMVNAHPAQHQEFARKFGRNATNADGYFRLYCRP
jgi:branched-subunit amino acid transport protein